MKSSSKMTDVKAAGVIGATACAIALAEFPMWLMGGEMPQFSDMTAFSEFATRHSTLYLTRTLMDLFIFSLLLVFFGGFRHLVVMTQASSEWLATTFVGIGAVYTAVTLVSDSLTGSIALDTVGGKADPTVIRALNESTVLMFGSVGVFLIATMMVIAGTLILRTNALPRGRDGWPWPPLCGIWRLFRRCTSAPTSRGSTAPQGMDRRPPHPRHSSSGLRQLPSA